jgi:hypothetical protein
MKDPYREPVLADVAHAGDLAYIPKEVTELADRIARQQNCKVTLSKESSGYHLYMPCPACLHSHGKSELRDPKYAINLSKYFGIGDEYRHLSPSDEQSGFNPVGQARNEAVWDEKNLRTGICMRTWQSNKPHRFSVEELLTMVPISERHPDIHSSYRVINGADSEDRESHWMEDPITGKLCPPPAGEIVPLSELSPFHPARWYMETYRRFDIKRLEELYRCGFCIKEYPESKIHKIWYRKFPGGWKDTPQNRIVFHALHDGVPLSWQARYIEVVSEDGLTKRGLNPYTNEWDVLATRATAKQAWIPYPPFDELDQEGQLRFAISKYKTAKHSARQLMGWDAAIRRADQDDHPIRWCVLTEGPLDAGRIGPGGIALMGKSISGENANKVVSNFDLVLTACDNDKAGLEATERISQELNRIKGRNSRLRHVGKLVIPTGKDLGDLDQTVADDILRQTINRAMRHL